MLGNFCRNDRNGEPGSCNTNHCGRWPYHILCGRFGDSHIFFGNR